MSHVLRTVGRYDLLDVIGRGGAAVVYLARQRDLDRHVALKELAPIRAGDETFAQRFIAESRITSSMNHPNVVTVHEFFEHEGIPYIAMEYLPRGSLRRYIGDMSTAQIAGVLEGVLAGLSHGERHGVVHRDLKPENLLVTEDGRVKIADFGVARAYKRAAPREAITATGATIGTPTYMAPEQALGNELTHAADLYSLGVIAWEMLSGKPPFEEADTAMAVLYRHVNEPVPPLNPDVDPRLDVWVNRMMAKTPGDRFASADTAWEKLEDIVLDLAGPRWRRDAPLVRGEAARSARPLAPATFERAESGPLRRGLRRQAGVIAVLTALAGGGVAVGLAAAGGGTPRPSADARIPGILRALERAQVRGAAHLQRAHTPTAYGAAATDIQGAYRHAASQLESLPPTRDSRTLAHEVSATAGDYGDLARAARTDSRTAYRQAAAQVSSDESRIRATARHL
jgi:tRNA A-37 threonylcarbamoyl transferase component Bud32